MVILAEVKAVETGWIPLPKPESFSLDYTNLQPAIQLIFHVTIYSGDWHFY
jgi:hypothetical protein